MVHAKDADRFIRGDVLVGHVELGDAKQKTTNRCDGNETDDDRIEVSKEVWFYDHNKLIA
jgi:hypothetical protein